MRVLIALSTLFLVNLDLVTDTDILCSSQRMKQWTRKVFHLVEKQMFRKMNCILKTPTNQPATPPPQLGSILLSTKIWFVPRTFFNKLRWCRFKRCAVGSDECFVNLSQVKKCVGSSDLLAFFVLTTIIPYGIGIINPFSIINTFKDVCWLYQASR